MKIEVTYEEGVTILSPQGELTIGAGDVALRKAVREAVEQGAKNIQLDLTGVTTVDASGCEELVSAYTELSKRGGKLTFLNVPPHVALYLKEMGQPESKKHLYTPDWARAPFQRFADDVDRLGEVIHLSIRGIAGLRGMPGLLEALAAESGETADAERLMAARKDADLAAREVEEGFPVLHTQAVVSLWSQLEALVREFVAEWLRREPGSLGVPPVKKLRVRVGEYESLSPEDRYRYIVDLLEREVGVGLRTGVKRFEDLLAPFGLSGAIEADVKRSIFELAQVRNAIVHRAGLADRQLVEACPWLGWGEGDPLIVSPEMLQRYLGAVHGYALVLYVRVGEHFGRDMSEFKPGKRVPDTSVN